VFAEVDSDVDETICYLRFERGVIEVSIDASGYEGQGKERLFVFCELCFHLSGPSPRVCLQLFSDLFENRSFEGTVRFHCFSPRHFVSAEVRVFIGQTNLVEETVTGAWSA